MSDRHAAVSVAAPTVVKVHSDGSAGARCGAVEHGEPCAERVQTDAALGLCAGHLLAAYDWVAREVGVTDLLPSPCRACGSRLGVRYPSGWLCAICEWRVGDSPDSDTVVPRVDVVYYLRFRDRIKIGTSATPRRRLAALRYDELLAFERGGRELEQRRHAQFASHRIPRTEWFDQHDELTEHIDRVSAGVEDPWSQLRLWISQHLALHR